MSEDVTLPLVRIAVVEDNLADVYLLRQALQEAQFPFVLDHLEDGEEALDFLLQRNRYSHAPRPDLVVLDLNLPKVSGDQVLVRMRERPELQQVLVVVWTSSTLWQDQQRMTALHVDAYIVKPADVAAFLQIGQTIKSLLQARRRDTTSGPNTDV